MGIEIKLPQLAEGVDKGDVVNVYVKVGDEIAEDAPLLELESEKATISVPSPQKGKISKILVKVGDKIKVGQPIVELEGAPAAGAGEPKAEAPPAAPASPQAPQAEKPKPEAARRTIWNSSPSPTPWRILGRPLPGFL